MRASWLAVGAFAVVGCRTPVAPHPADPSPTPPPRGEGLQQPAPPSFPGKGDGGSGSSTTDEDPLTLAARCLQDGNDAAACAHLEAHVRAYPEQVMFRAHLAELLVKLGKDADAKRHFERFVTDAKTATGPVRGHLVHCHTRLMEIAGRADDRGAELYHRGGGLLLLVREQDNDPPARDDDFCEEVLCKALAALREAKELRPTDPGVRQALADVYERTGNRRAAEVERAAARFVE